VADLVKLLTATWAILVSDTATDCWHGTAM
jgi:hypothetical protein